MPRSRRALETLAEVDRAGLRDKLLDLADSPKGRLRCVALYGLMKHFGYKGTYDPFLSGAALGKAAKDLRAHLAAKP